MSEITQEKSPKELRRVAGAALIGSSLEWYDFFLYATAAALVFGKVFFPDSDPVVGTLLSLATFGVGFFARPLGAVIFGVMGDKLGRRPALVATLVLMGGATTLIGLLPGHATIGIMAPTLLVIFRLLQGLGAGAEHAGATIFSAEYAKPSKRGFYGAIPGSGLYIGVLLSSSIFALFSLMPEEAFLSWGWRVPFLLSVILIAVGLFIRIQIDETPTFKAAEANEVTTRTPLRDTFRYQWRSVLVVIGIVAGPFTATYAYQTYSLTYMDAYLGMSGNTGVLALSLASVVAIIMVPVAGAASDRFGRRAVIIVGAIFSGAFAFPFFGLLGTLSPAAVVLAMVGGVGVGVPLMLGPQGALLAELFSASNRFTGFALSRELGSILFAGMTPFIAGLLVAAASGSSWPVSAYVIGSCVITLITGIAIKETRPTAEASASVKLSGNLSRL